MNNNNNISKIELEINKIESDILAYKTKAESQVESVRDEANVIIKSFTEKKNDFEKKLSAIRETSGNVHDDVQIGITMAWNDLSIAYDSAKERLQTVL